MTENHKSPLVYGLILNWNGLQETIGCLLSMLRQTYPNLNLLVVDNGSSDGSASHIRRAFPNVELISNEKNLGFAGGVNVGLEYAFEAGAEYVLVLNNDMTVDPGCLEEMMSHVAEDVAFVTAAVYYSNDPNRIWSIGGRIHPLTLEKTCDARGKLDLGQYPALMAREFVPGGATLMARRVLETIGVFDDKYFLYYEDADLSLRAHRSGFRSVVATRAKMWHGVSSSSGGSDSPRERYWMAHSSIRYFFKNAEPWQWPAVLFWRAGSALRTTFRLVQLRKYDALAAYWRGLKDGIRHIRS